MWCSASTSACSRKSETPADAAAASRRIEDTAGERRGVELAIHREVRHVAVHHIGERTNHQGAVARRRLEEELHAIDAVDDPGMLPVGIGLLCIAHHPTDVKLSLEADFGQLSPRP